MFRRQDVKAISTTLERDFIWVAEYLDGTWLLEFQREGAKWNSFYTIDRQNLIRFGYIGHGSRLFFEPDGVFFVNGVPIEFVYKVGNEEYNLTGQPCPYNDIIQYKDGAVNMQFNTDKSGVCPSQIGQYNFGYKVNYKIKDIGFNFRALCKIPFKKPVYFNVRLVADRDLDGKLGIKINNRIVDELDAPLVAGVAGELNYILHRR